MLLCFSSVTLRLDGVQPFVVMINFNGKKRTSVKMSSS